MAYVDELGILIAKLSNGEITKAEFTASKERILNAQTETVYTRDDILDESIPYLERLQLIRRLLKQGSITVAEFTEYKTKLVATHNGTVTLTKPLQELVDEGVLTAEEAAELNKYKKKAEVPSVPQDNIPPYDSAYEKPNKRKVYLIGVITAAALIGLLTQLGGIVNLFVDNSIIAKSVSEADQYGFLSGLSDGDKKDVIVELMNNSKSKATLEGFKGKMFESARNIVDTTYDASLEVGGKVVGYKSSTQSKTADLKSFLMIKEIEECLANTNAPITVAQSGVSEIAFTCSYKALDDTYRSVIVALHAKADFAYSITYKEDNETLEVHKEQKVTINW
jgi:hypothetical protein